jgi:hypothetical protein
MRIIQNKDLGFYVHNFFRLHISTRNSNTDLDLNQLNDRDFSVFLHEYIHFLQNITTFYGLNNIHISVEYMRYANNKILSDKNPNFIIPIIPDETNSNNVKLNRYLSDITFGDGFDNTTTTINKITNYSIENDPIKIVNSHINNIESVCIEFIDNNNEANCFSFGANCIMESMAYLIETLSCNDYAKSPNLPYETATMLADFIYPKFAAKTKLNILALCDISLNCSNPAVYFVKTIEDWKQKKKVPACPQELYNDCIKLNPNILENLCKISNMAISQLQEYFKDNYFTPIRNWANDIIHYAIKLRKNNPFFVLDIANGNIRQNHIFCEIFKTIGTPLLTNENGFTGCYYPNGDTQQQIGNFLAISQIQKIFYTGTFDYCELVDYNCCNNAVDCRCKTAPWKRCLDKNLCPFALFWHHWGLGNYEPIIKK